MVGISKETIAKSLSVRCADEVMDSLQELLLGIPEVDCATGCDDAERHVVIAAASRESSNIFMHWFTIAINDSAR